MKARRVDGRVAVKIANGKITIEINLFADENTKEIYNVFRYGKYLIKINQTRPIKLRRIPRVNDGEPFMLSLEEARSILDHLHLDDDFSGEIDYLRDEKNKDVPIIIFNFHRIISQARKDKRSIRRALVRTLAHEIRHLEQDKKDILKSNKLWNFLEWYQNLNDWLKIKGISWLKVIFSWIIGAILIFVTHLLYIGIISVFVLSLIDLILTDKKFSYAHDPSEKDAETFAEKAVNNRKWRDCVEVTKIKRGTLR